MFAILVATGLCQTGFAQEILYDWHLQAGSPVYGEDSGKSIMTDAQGNLYMTGDFYGTADFDPSDSVINLTSHGETDVFVAKYAPSGTYQWAFNIGGTGYDQVNSIFIDISGNVYITGYFEETVDFDPAAGVATKSAAIRDIYITKYNSDGIYQWVIAVGGTGYDEGVDVEVSGLGSVYVGGYFNGTVDFNPGAGVANITSFGYSDMFIARYTGSGSFLGAYKIGGASAEFMTELTLDPQNNVLITGIFQGTADFNPGAGIANLTAAPGLGDACVAKYSATGVYQWAFGIGNTAEEHGYDVVTDAQSNVYVTGNFLGTADFDPSASVVNLTATGNDDVFLAKYSASGAYQWAFGVGGVYSFGGDGLSMARDGFNNIYLTGMFYGTEDFDPSSGISNLVAMGGGPDVFVAKYNEDGEFLKAVSLNGPSSTVASAIAIDNDQNFYITGHFYESMDVDPSDSVATLTSVGSGDIFLAHYKISFDDFREVIFSDINKDQFDSRSNAWTDYDNDGDQDVVVGNTSTGFNLYQNQGNQKFTNKTGVSIISNPGQVYGSSWGDFNNDGYVDLFVANGDLYSPNELFKNNGDGSFTNITQGDIRKEVTYSEGGSWADYDSDGKLDLLVANWHYLYPDSSNSLYRGNGDGTFEKVVTSAFANDLGSASAGCAWSDIDNDGDIDAYVWNVAEQESLLYFNNGDGTFSKDESNEIANPGNEAVNAIFGDYDNDGDQDVYLSRRSDALYQNDGSGNFTQVVNAQFSAEYSDGAAWGDYDNDGDLDLFLSNGGANRANSLYENNGDGSFTKINSILTQDLSNSRSTSWVDINQDGDLDLFVTNVFNGNKLFENPGNNKNWIEIKLKGVQSNRSGTGARVRVRTGNKWQMREVFSQKSTSLLTHFGLNNEANIDVLRIDWPSGNVQVLKNVAANQILTIEEDSSPNTPHTLSPLSFSGLEDDKITFGPNIFSNAFDDIEGDVLKEVRIISLPLNGTLLLLSTPLVEGQTISLTDQDNLSFIPTENWNGNTTFEYQAIDDRGLEISSIITLQVTNVNDAPQFSIASNTVELEDFSELRLIAPVMVPPLPDETSELITFTLSPSSIDYAALSFQPATGVVSISSLSNKSGSQEFTLTVSDGQIEYSEVFTFTVTAVNDAPFISAMIDIELQAEDENVSVIFTVEDVDSELSSITLEASSGNQEVLPSENLSVHGTEGERTLTIIMEAGKSGQSEITLTASDGSENFIRKFTVNITAITGIENSNGDGTLLVTPNPATSEVALEFQNQTNVRNAKYFIMNSMGTLVKMDKANVGSDMQARIDIHDISPGVYFIRVILNDDRIYTQKFIKK